MKKITLLIFLFCFSMTNAQTLWKKQVNSEKIFSKSELKVRKTIPNKFDIYTLNLNDFRGSLSDVSKSKQKVILLPSVGGELAKFSIKEDSNFSTKLSTKFNQINSYSAQGISDPTAVAKISIGTDGVHIMIMSGKHSTFYVDPYTKDIGSYIGYERKSLPSGNKEFECLIDENQSLPNTKIETRTSARNAGDSKLREYRLAIVCSGEYAQFHINAQGVPASATDAVKKAAVLSAMNTSMSRINGVYERDLSVKMVIVSNNEDVIFLDAATDNITDGDAGAMINEVQTICDNFIGASNYDIGHVFSTAGSGLARVNSVCINGIKAKGVTGIATPVGDPYDIDYVSHEIGHQFGATHTQNNGCNRSDNTAVEPGSASTIMGYAGICGPNVQSNSDDHFNAISIDQMWTHIQVSGSCADATAIDTNNATPVANAGNDVSIPRSTPFILKGIGTDADGNESLTYNWEQQDNELSTQPPLPTNTAGPNFRSSPSSISPNRYMPSLTTVLGGSTANTWEVVPAVARKMNFSLVVRDNKAGGGASARDDMEVTVTDANPFLVTSQSSSETWDSGTTQTITWDKSTTNIAPINCANVKIKLSIDGGNTFPIVLAESTPNDGSHSITVPDHPTTSARIMVEAVGNIFYNLNSAGFIINSTTPTFNFSNSTDTQRACNTGSDSVSYILNLDFVNGFAENVSFSAINQPVGAIVSFSPSTISGDGNVTMTVSNLDGATEQLNTIEVTATSATTGISKTVNAKLEIIGNSFSDLTLNSPSNNQVDVVLLPELNWELIDNADVYDVQVATDNAFSALVVEETINTNSYTVSSTLNVSTTYFWRVKPKNNCGEGSFSTIYSFTTLAPAYCDSTFSESANSEWISNVTFNTINNDSDNDYDSNTDGVLDGYQDFTAISTVLNTSDMYEVSVTFDTAGFQDHVYVFIDWNQDYQFNLTDERYDLGTHFDDVSTATMNITIPANAVIGNTRMRVVLEYTKNDQLHGDGPCTANYSSGYGETEDYTLEIQNPSASIEDFAFSGFNLYPNPSNGEINLAFEVINTDEVKTQLYDLRGRKVSQQTFKNVSTQFSEKLTYDTITTGIYLLRISNGGKVSTRKIIIK
ncbi:hypothetical protein LPB136_08085 [Tenacibaculum todarodis]|uniref:Fibronectin type-III domain-containing protein n=1 Tax=Tenacibaculum todarodis TaxID=1850252 RepID=A0A1L3JJJ6_9FLAO|nr:zinc-dependent metalloprotease family protein [Tenacibaculum todarodis]APG65311.1 hypothetical protein LPB136_08085 [Tenacibaculum todarodis]